MMRRKHLELFCALTCGKQMYLAQQESEKILLTFIFLHVTVFLLLADTACMPSFVKFFSKILGWSWPL